MTELKINGTTVRLYSAASSRVELERDGATMRILDHGECVEVRAFGEGATEKIEALLGLLGRQPALTVLTTVDELPARWVVSSAGEHMPADVEVAPTPGDSPPVVPVVPGVKRRRKLDRSLTREHSAYLKSGHGKPARPAEDLGKDGLWRDVTGERSTCTYLVGGKPCGEEILTAESRAHMRDVHDEVMPEFRARTYTRPAGRKP